jgi:hypothetical protein
MEIGFGHYEGGLGSLQPDVLLPSQYFDRVRSRSEHDPERRLHDYVKNIGAHERQKRELFLDAEQWIEDRDGSWFLSFENICHVLDLDAEYVRRGLRRWKAEASGDARGADSRPSSDDRDLEPRRAVNA